MSCLGGITRVVDREVYAEIVRNDKAKYLLCMVNIFLEEEYLTLYTGTDEWCFVDFDYFKPSGSIKYNNVCTPDFTDPSIIDYGNTLKLGDYEASVGAMIKDHE